MSGPLTGRRALVVGGTRGIGLACSRRIAAAGASVTVVARTRADLEALVVDLPGDGHQLVDADVTTGEGVTDLVDALAATGQPDVVVASARGPFTWAPLRSTEPGSVACRVRENLTWLEAIAPRALVHQRGRVFGRWIGISSVVAHTGGPGQSAYVAVKAALEAILRTLAVEEGAYGITANSVVCGFVDTDATRGGYDGERFAKLSAMGTLGRPLDPDEVAHAVAFLADPLAAGITGASLPVCGGFDLAWMLQSRPDGGADAGDVR